MEQLNLRSHQRIASTVEESVLKTEMTGLESQEEDAPKCILFFKSMSWLGHFRPHRRHESCLLVSDRHFSPRLWTLRSPRTSDRLHSDFIRILFLQAHRETDRFFAASGVQSTQSNTGAFFHFLRAAFSSMLNSLVSSILAKPVDLRITLNLDGAPITSKSHTHPSHSQTSRLLTSFLSLGVPVPRPTQCM